MFEALRRHQFTSQNSRLAKGVSDNPAKYPETYAHDSETQEITVGDRRFGPVSPQVWEFAVSGLEVVQIVAWLPDEEAGGQEILTTGRHPPRTLDGTDE